MNNLKSLAVYYVTLCIVFTIIAVSSLAIGLLFCNPSLEALVFTTFFWTLGVLASIVYGGEAKRIIKQIK